MKKTQIISILILCFLSCKEKPKTVNKDNVQLEETNVNMDYSINTKSTHALKTQLYRWYSFYEREMTDKRIANQLTLLSDSIVINSMGKKVEGKERYTNILPIYKGTKNAHNLRSADILNSESKKLNSRAKITFQTMRPDGSNSQMNIDYNLRFTEFDGKTLPKFNNIEITPSEQQQFNSFNDTYSVNRVSALMHYWLFNIEQMDGDAEPFKQLLANNFELHFSKDNIINTTEQFEQWIKKAGSSVSETNHFPENVTIKTLDKNLYELNVEFIWRGKSKDGIKLQAHTVHKWIVEDDINAPFAKIRKMEVSYKIPFSPLKE